MNGNHFFKLEKAILVVEDASESQYAGFLPG